MAKNAAHALATQGVKTTPHVFTFYSDGGKYTIDSAKLEQPLTMLYMCFEDDMEILDAFHQLNVIVDRYIMDYKETYEGSKDLNMIALAHNVEKVLAVHQVLAAVAMFFNSLEFVPGEE